MVAVSEASRTAALSRGASRAVPSLSMWGGDTLVYRSVIALAGLALPLISLANWLAYGRLWGPQLMVAGGLLAVALACYALARRGMEDTAAALLIGAIWCAATIFAFGTGFGLHSSVIYLYLPCLLYSVLFFGVTIAVFELLLTIAALLIMYWAEESGAIGGVRAFAAHSSNLNFLIGILVTCAGTLAAGVVYHRRVASEAARVIAEANQRRAAMEQAQLAQAQLETANAKLQELNAELARRGRQHALESVRAKRDIDLYHDVVSRDIPASLQALRLALAKPDGPSEALQGEIGRMEAVARALAELGRSEPALARTPIELTLLGNEVVGQLRAGNRFAKVRIDFAPNLQASGDRQMVAALLRHLISRAAAACQGEAEPQVHVGGASRDGKPLFYVRDNGPGMEAARLEKLFRPFERGAPEENTDIGLISARRIAERHGGELFAESTPGRGTTFYFSLV